MISIITPHYNMLRTLKLTCASVNDQDVPCEHIIVDACSSDGTKEWLKKGNLKYIIEEDEGMYDAINKGIEISQGNIIGYLNSDEQYLNGTLKFVSDFFDKNGDVDIIFMDTIIIDEDGNLLSLRKGYKPISQFIKSNHLYNLSCSMFFKRKIFDNHYKFNTSFKDVGDMDFVLNVLKNYKSKYIRKVSSTFCYSGNNMSLSTNAQIELKTLRSEYKIHQIVILNILRLVFKFFSGCYFMPNKISYHIYTNRSLQKRKSFTSHNISWRWPSDKIKN